MCRRDTRNQPEVVSSDEAIVPLAATTPVAGRSGTCHPAARSLHVGPHGHQELRHLRTVATESSILNQQGAPWLGVGGFSSPNARTLRTILRSRRRRNFECLWQTPRPWKSVGVGCRTFPGSCGVWPNGSLGKRIAKTNVRADSGKGVSSRASNKGFLPVTQDQYLQLLDWTGRQARRGKRGRIPSDLAPILTRLHITNDTWVDMVENSGRWFRRAAGRQESLAQEASRRGRRWVQGVSRSRELFV